MAHELAALVSAQRGEALWLREYPAQVDDDPGRLILGVARDGLHQSRAVVSDVGAFATISIEVERAGVCGLAAFAATPAGRASAAAALIAELDAAPGDGDRVDAPGNGDRVDAPSPLAVARALAGARRRPGLLDAAVAVLDHLGQTLAVPEARWRLELWGHDHDAGAGASISLCGGPHAWPRLVTVGADRRGARWRVPGSTLGSPDHELEASTVDALTAQLSSTSALARAAVDGRAAFRARPNLPRLLARRLARALRERARLDADVVEPAEDFPYRAPAAEVVEVERGRAHALAALRALPRPGTNDDAVEVVIDDHRLTLTGEEALVPHLDELVRLARQLASRLTPARLTVEQVYQVLTPLAGLEPGQRVRFTGLDEAPRADACEYRFSVLGAQGGWLRLVDPLDAAVLAELHRYLSISVDPDRPAT